VSKGVHSIGISSVEESYSDSLTTLMHYVDNSYDASCILDSESFEPTYRNRKFKQTFGLDSNGSLPKILSNANPTQETLEKTCFEKLSGLDTNKTQHRFCVPISDVKEIEFTLLVPDKADSLLCTLRLNDISIDYASLQQTNQETELVLSSLENYKRIISASPFGIIKTDVNGTILFSANHSLYLDSEPNSSLTGLPVNDYFSLDRGSLLDQLIKKLVKQKKGSGTVIATTKHSNGNKKTVEINYSHITEDGESYFLIHYYDISDKLIAKSNLQESTQKIKSLMDLSSLPIIELTADAVIKKVSFSICNNLGISKEDIAGKSIYDFIAEDNHESFTHFIQSLKETEECSFSDTVQLSNGKENYLVVQISGKYISNRKTDKNEGEILLICENLTEKINSELALIEKESALHTLLENSPFGIYAIDIGYNITFINKNAVSSFKLQHNIDISLGDNLKDKIDKNTFAEWNRIYENVFSNNSFNKIGQVYNNPNKIVNNRYAPLKDAFGNVTGCIEVSHDITSIKLKEYQLLEREAYLNSILNSTPNPIIVIDPENNITAINPEAYNLYKQRYDAELFKGTNLKNVLADKVIDNYSDIYIRVYRGEVVNLIDLDDNNNSKSYFHYTFSPVKDHSGAIIGCKILIQDTTRTVESEKALLESELRYRQLLNLIPGGILMTKQDGGILYSSDSLNEILGIPKGKSIKAFGYHEFIKDVEAFRTTINENLKNDQDAVTQTLAANKSNGDVIWLKTQSKLVSFNDEQVILSIISDVTSKLKAEEENAINEKIYEILLKNSFQGTDVTEVFGDNDNPTYKLLLRNEKMKRFYNSDQHAFLNQEDMLKIKPKFQADGQLSADKMANDIAYFQKNKYLFIERQMYDIDRKLRNVLISIQTIQFQERTLVVRNYKDVTEMFQKDAEISLRAQELDHKNKELEKYIESNLNLENFAYITSHDLKSPIRTIMSFAQLLKKEIWDDLSAKNKTFLKIILESSNNMQSLIDDVLSYSKIGTEKLRIEEFYLKTFIDFSITELQNEITNHAAIIHLDIKPKLIKCDKVKLGQLLQNLIRNGIKFHKENEKPILTIAVQESENKYTFSVADNGIGIEKQEQKQIFGIFKQLNSKEKFGGNGIGLSTCNKITNLWNGKIWVESAKGVGSTFYFTVPKNIK